MKTLYIKFYTQLTYWVHFINQTNVWQYIIALWIR